MSLPTYLFKFSVCLLFSNLLSAQTVIDIDGNRYSTVQIGSQRWLGENLKTSRFLNGDSIPTTTAAVNNDSNALFRWAYDDDTALVPTYGHLYTWITATDMRGICPAGWRVPTTADWDSLIAFAGGDSIAANQLKDTGTQYWKYSSPAVNNATGFSARGSGMRGNPQGFINLRESAVFWSSNSFGNNSFPRGSTFILTANSSMVLKGAAVANVGACIRCIKSQPVNIHEKEPLGQWELYPNPSKGAFNFHLSAPANFSLSVHTLQGQMVYEKKFKNKQKILITEPIVAGSYIVIVRLEGGRRIRAKLLVP